MPERTWESVAERLGISIRQYIRYETGERPIPKYIPLACEALSAKEKH